MIALNINDMVLGSAGTSGMIDYSIFGANATAQTPLAIKDGQLPTGTAGTLYTATTTMVITSVVCSNNSTTTAYAVSLFYKPGATGTARNLLPTGLSLPAGCSLHYEGGKMMIVQPSGNIMMAGTSGTSGTTGTSGSSGLSGSSGTSPPPSTSGTSGVSGSSGSSGTTPYNQIVTSNQQSGTSYTLVASDVGKCIEFTATSGTSSLVIPTNASVGFAIDTRIDVLNQGSSGVGAGKVTVVGTAGVTLNSYGSNFSLAGQYAGATLTQFNINQWVLVGNLTA